MNFTRHLLGLSIAAAPLYMPAMAVGEQSSRAIEEVVVTSRRKDESQQDVPLSVTAFGAERIEQLKPTTLREFDGLAPNVYIGMNTAGPGASALYIRGVGYADIEKTQSPQVGVIVDGIQIGSSTGQLIDVFDIESVEINRGPQGVLFGKNSIGGNIVVNRVRPQFNDYSLNASYEVGTYDSNSVKVRLNLPLIEDTLALKIGGTQRTRQGYYHNATLNQSAGDIDFASSTLSLRWAPTDNLDAILTYDRIEDRSQIPPQDPRFNGDDPFENLSDKVEPTSYNVSQWGLRVTWDISDKITLYSITGLHDGSDQVNQDFDGATINSHAVPFAQLHTLRTQRLEVFTEELRVAVDINEQWDFLLGYYHYDSELDFQQRTNQVQQLPSSIFSNLFPPLILPEGEPCENTTVGAGVKLGLRDHPVLGNTLCQFPNSLSTQLAGEEVESKAFFGSVTYYPLPELELLFGIRRIDEEKNAFNSYFSHSNGMFDSRGPALEFDFTGRPRVPGNAYAESGDWQDTIITASISYALRDTSNFYLNYAEGFRSGGFSIRSARRPSEAIFQPEEADQIEIGVKNELLSGRLMLNLAYYMLTLENGQFSSVITLPPGSIPGTTTIINNADDAEYRGWELETRFVVNDNWVLSLNGGVIDVDNKAYSRPCDIIDGCATAVPGVSDPSGTLRHRGGDSYSRQPDWSMAASAAFTSDLGKGIFSASGGYKKVGSFQLTNTGAGGNVRLFESGYGQWEARIAYDLPLEDGSTLSISAYGRNLSDVRWREQALLLGSLQSGFQGWGAPKVAFLEIRYSR